MIRRKKGLILSFIGMLAIPQFALAILYFDRPDIRPTGWNLPPMSLLVLEKLETIQVDNLLIEVSTYQPKGPDFFVVNPRQLNLNGTLSSVPIREWVRGLRIYRLANQGRILFYLFMRYSEPCPMSKCPPKPLPWFDWSYVADCDGDGIFESDFFDECEDFFYAADSVTELIRRLALVSQ